MRTLLPSAGELVRYVARSGVYRVVRHLPLSLAVVVVAGFFVLAGLRAVLAHRRWRIRRSERVRVG